MSAHNIWFLKVDIKVHGLYIEYYVIRIIFDCALIWAVFRD